MFRFIFRSQYQLFKQLIKELKNDHSHDWQLNPYSAGIDFSRQNLTSVAHSAGIDFSRQNLMSVASKIDPRTVREKIFLMAVDT